MVFHRYNPGPCTAALAQSFSPTYSIISISPESGQRPFPNIHQAGHRPAPSGNFIRASAVP